MPKPKSLILSMSVDIAAKSHNCQHSAGHRIQRGDLRLRVKESRSPDYYCVDCARIFIKNAMADLAALGEGLSRQGTNIEGRME
jgi:hypothetical protein